MRKLRSETRCNDLVGPRGLIRVDRECRRCNIRPEMATLDGLSVLFCADLPAPKEDEPPKLDMRRGLFDGHETGDNDDSEEPQNDEWEDEDDHQE